MSGGGGGGTEVTEEERGLAETGAAKWNDYQQRFVPVENNIIEQIKATPEKAQELAGIANADVHQQFEPVSTSTNLRGLVDAYDRQGKVLANAVPKAAGSVNDTQMQGMLKMAAYGRGLSDQAALSTYKVGSNATQTAVNAANKKAAKETDMLSSVGTAVGMGTRYGLDKYYKG